MLKMLNLEFSNGFGNFPMSMKTSCHTAAFFSPKIRPRLQQFGLSKAESDRSQLPLMENFHAPHS
jgi:hypothetical protein